MGKYKEMYENHSDDLKAKVATCKTGEEQPVVFEKGGKWSSIKKCTMV